MRMMTFKVNAEHVPEKELVVADIHARNPLAVKSQTSDKEDAVKAYVDSCWNGSYSITWEVGTDQTFFFIWFSFKACSWLYS